MSMADTWEEQVEAAEELMAHMEVRTPACPFLNPDEIMFTADDMGENDLVTLAGLDETMEKRFGGSRRCYWSPWHPVPRSRELWAKERETRYRRR